MAKGVNKVMLLGNVGKDPEIKSTQGGMQIATFGLATAERTKGADGQWTDKTEWHNIVCFQRTAEIVRDYVKKGNQVFIEGRLSTRSWDDKETGQKKSRTEILCNELTLLGGRAAGGEGGSSYAQSNSGGYGRSQASSSSNTQGGGSGYGQGGNSYDQRQPASTPDYGESGITDDDIPF